MTEHVEVAGEVIQVARDKFLVKLDYADNPINAQLSGKMRLNKIRVLLGDRVQIKMSPYDLSHGIIVARK